MKVIYVAGFFLLALLNGFGLAIFLNPSMLGVGALPINTSDPMYIVSIVILGIVTLLSLASSILFLIKSQLAYKVGLITGIIGFLVALVRISLIGVFFYGLIAYEMFKKRNDGLD